MAIDVLQRGDLPFPRSLPEFQRLFPDEAACTAYLERTRWNSGFTCLHWGATGEPYRITTRPGVLRCRNWHDTRLTAGTVRSARTRRSRRGSERPTWSPARRRACWLSSSNGNSDCRATKPPSRFSTNSGLAWFAPTRTGSGASPAKSLRLMKPTWAGVHAAWGAASTSWYSWLVPSKSTSVSVPAASINGRMGGMQAVFDLPWFRTEAPNRLAASSRVLWYQAPGSSQMIGAAMPVSASMATTTYPSWNGAIRRSPKCSCPSSTSCSPILRPGCAASIMAVSANAYRHTSQRVHISLQPPFLSLQRFPILARHHQRRHRTNLCRALLRKIRANHFI